MDWEVSTAPMCRACMEIDGSFIPMDQDLVSRKNLLRKLVDLTSIKIDENDGLPTMLCTKCAYRTNAFYEFKRLVRNTEKKLRKMFEVTMDPVKVETPDNDSVNDTNVGSSKTPKQEFLNSVNDVDPKEQTIQILQVADGVLEPIDQEISIDPHKIEFLEGKINEFTNIFDSNGIQYAIAYIPDEEINSVLDEQAVQAVLTNPGISQENTNSNTNNLQNARPTSVNEASGQSHSVDVNSLQGTNCKETNLGRTVTEIINLEGDKSEETNLQNDNDDIDNDEVDDDDIREIDDNIGEENSIESEDSDNEYFIGPKDDIVGSLNDTITRIKEIKKDGDKLEFQCTLCLQNYDELSKVLIHIVENHVPNAGPFFCIVCEKDCESRRELRQHVKTHTGPYPYTCFICRKAYAMKRYLKRHMVCHTDFPRHRCPKCGVRYKIKSELDTHLSTHAHGPAYQCNQCTRVFNHKGNYKRHLMSHLDPMSLHLPKYPCTECGKRFLNNRTLETHYRVHTGEKPFKCQFCSKQFSQQGNLLNHVRSVHSNPRSHTCKVCGKSFNQKATLKDHSLLHTGEKPYVCTVCGMAFTFSSAMRRHMWTHSAGKPFGCDICQARFIGKYDLKRHLRVHLQKPKSSRKRSMVQLDNVVPEEFLEEVIVLEPTPNSGEMLMEPILLADDMSRISPQKESERENVDALFNLIQYG